MAAARDNAAAHGLPNSFSEWGLDADFALCAKLRCSNRIETWQDDFDASN